MYRSSLNRPSFPGRTSLFTAAGLTILAAYSLAVSPVAHSAEGPQYRVQLSDLDLATPKGLRVLTKRIDAAVEIVCAHPNRALPRSRAVEKEIDACRTAAMEDVRDQLISLGVRPDILTAKIR